MEKPSWVCTLLTQICLCFALYLSFHLGERQTPVYQSSNGRGTPHDLYFLSVRGGYRFPQQQLHLLQRMEKVAKTYQAKFVVNISELGEDDPLMQNGTLHFPSLKVPWYTTTTSQGERKGYFLKQVAITHGQVLDIIGLDTGSVQGYQHTGKAGRVASNQLQWLTRILGVTDSNWCIVAGFHPLAVCEEEEQTEMMHVSETLQHIFLKFGVNAYLSQQGCSDYTRQVSITNIGIPGLLDRENNRTSSINTSSTFSRFLTQLTQQAKLYPGLNFIRGGRISCKFDLEKDQLCPVFEASPQFLRFSYASFLSFVSFSPWISGHCR